MSRARAVSHASSKPDCGKCGKCGKGLRSNTCQRNLCRGCCEKIPLNGCGNVYHNKTRIGDTSAAPSAPPPTSDPASAHPAPAGSIYADATPSPTSSQSTSEPSGAQPPATTTPAKYADPLNPLWTRNNALGAVIQQARDEGRAGAATVKGKEREERDMVQQKTIDIQLWVQPASSPCDISEYIATYPILTLSSISSVLRHLPPETATVAVWNRRKGKWQEREVGSPIALREGEHEVFIRVVGLSDMDCVGLPSLIQAASIVPKRPRSPSSYAHQALTSSPTKRVKSVHITNLLPSTSPSTSMFPTMASSSASGLPALSPGRACGPYLGLLEAPTFTSVPPGMRSGQFPTKFSFAEVIRYLRRLDSFISMEGMTQTTALAHLGAQLGVSCCDSNLGRIKMDLRAGDYDLWSRFMAASSTADGSWAAYRTTLKREGTGRLAEVAWAKFPPEEIPPAQDAGDLSVQLSQVALAPSSDTALSYDSSMTVTPYDSSSDDTGYGPVVYTDLESQSDPVDDGVPSYGEDTSNEPPGSPTPDPSSPSSFPAPSAPGYSDHGDIPAHATQACYNSNTVASESHVPDKAMASPDPAGGFLPYPADDGSQLTSGLHHSNQSPIFISQELIQALLSHASDFADDQGSAPCEPMPPNPGFLSHTAPGFFTVCPLHGLDSCPHDCLHCTIVPADWTSHSPPSHDASPAADSTGPGIADDTDLQVEAAQPGMHGLVVEFAGISAPTCNTSAWSSLEGALTF